MLEICVHLRSGTVERFYQDDEARVLETMTSLQPSKLFSEPHLYVAGDHSVTVYPSSAVAMVEFITGELPEWIETPAGTHAHEITPEAFLTEINSAEGSTLRESPRPVGEVFVGYAQLELSNGERLHAEIHTKVGLPLEQAQLMNRLLALPSFNLNRLGGGRNRVNPQDIVRCELCPGPATVPTHAFRAGHSFE